VALVVYARAFTPPGGHCLAEHDAPPRCLTNLAGPTAGSACSVRQRGAEESVQKEAVMTTSRRPPFVVLGLQTWAILVAVLALVLLAGVLFLNW
jgi:hypothetical protein